MNYYCVSRKELAYINNVTSESIIITTTNKQVSSF